MKHFTLETLSELRETGIKFLVCQRSGYNKVLDSETYILYPFKLISEAYTLLVDTLKGTKYEEQLVYTLYKIDDDEIAFMAIAKDSYAYWLKVIPTEIWEKTFHLTRS